MGLLTLQLAKGIADVDALDLRGLDLGLVERAQSGLAHDVGDVLPVAGPGF